MQDERLARTLTLAPFRGLRYAPAFPLGAVLTPPYDVVERDEALALAAGDDHNFVRLVLPEGLDPAATATETLTRWIDEGVLTRDARPAVYVYEQADADGRVLQRGLVGALALPDPQRPVVLLHENVMPGPIEGRSVLMRATEANLEPIWLLYRGGGGAASRLVETTAGVPLEEALTSDGIRHRLWGLTDFDTLAELNADLAPRQALLVDGHHRYASYQLLQAEHPEAGPWDRGLALLVDLETHPPAVDGIHRHIDVLSRRDAVAAAARVPGLMVEDRPDGDWRTALSEVATGALVLVGDDGATSLVRVTDRALVDEAVVATLPAGAVPPPRWRALDTVLLHHVLLPTWRTPQGAIPEAAISYHHEAAHAVERARAEGGTTVLLPPVDVADVFELAEQGVRMPRKSTSFGPKPRSGLVLRTWTDDVAGD